MKKTILSIALVAVGMAAFAQKPAAGDKTAEFNLSFQTGTAPVSYGLGSTALPGTPELRLRYFMADDMAIRVRFGAGSSSTTTKFSDNAPSPATQIESEVKTSTGFGIALTPGIEKHFAGSDKLSPFVGAELPIGFGSGATTEVSNSSSATGTPISNGDSYKNEAGSQFNVGLRIVMGADYYIADGLYLGIEGGLGLFSLASVGDGTETTTVGGVNTEIKTLGSSTVTILGAAAGTVRLGYKF
jgi:hypothetical protein